MAAHDLILRSEQIFSWLRDFIFKEHNRLFAGVGAVTATYVSWSLLGSLWRGFRNYFLSGPLNLAVDFKKYGEWAVVTGATDGIGKAYAKQLAKRGVNVVLLSRSEDKLKRVASEIEGEYNVKIKTIAVDFTNGSEIYGPISSKLRGLEIGTLVNNVGMGGTAMEYFHLIKNKEQTVPNLLNVNCLSCTMMTSIILPLMLQKKKGIIINNASILGMKTPVPLSTVYCATKAYVDFFSRGLQAEYASDGIIVQSLLPGLVSTNMTKNIKTNFITVSADKFASQAIGTVGLEERTNGCLAHDILGWFLANFQNYSAKNQLPRAKKAKAMLESLDAKQPKN